MISTSRGGEARGLQGHVRHELVVHVLADVGELQRPVQEERGGIAAVVVHDLDVMHRRAGFEDILTPSLGVPPTLLLV